MKKFLLAAAALILQACVSVLPDAPPPAARYQVTDVTVDSAGRTPVAWTLAVEEPNATLAFNTAKIALSREPARIEYYAGGEWVDRAPRIFGTALIRSFENTGAIKGIGSRMTQPASTFVLQTDMRELAVTHRAGAMTADAAVFARLTNGRSTVFASRLFTASTPVAEDNAGAAAKALNQGLDRIQRDLLDWTFSESGRASVK